MKKLKLYIETSVWNFLISSDVPYEQKITKELFNEIESGEFEIYISELVYAEIEKAPQDIKNKLKMLIEKYKPTVLERSGELAKKYMSEKIVPEKYKADLLHIAFAVVYNLDVVISWNLEHIVKLTTKLKVNGVNRKEGYKEIEICTPQEVIR